MIISNSKLKVVILKSSKQNLRVYINEIMAGLTKYRPVFFSSATKNFRLYIQNNVPQVKKKKNEINKKAEKIAAPKKEESVANIEKIIVEESLSPKESFRYKVCEERTPHQVVLTRPKLTKEKMNDSQNHLQPCAMATFFGGNY